MVLVGYWVGIGIGAVLVFLGVVVGMVLVLVGDWLGIGMMLVWYRYGISMVLVCYWHGIVMVRFWRSMARVNFYGLELTGCAVGDFPIGLLSIFRLRLLREFYF